ncbi:hypothetical protein VC35_15465 [Pseudomonas fluorescens]|uniref:Uncharacterized protein n=1 Tax=Pseudomonas fluorescens TaxID=294 RepID=A0A0F4TLZ9_PSEFL|nr:hypothetical protein VC35_15465 [Pseudomonas fluorescens]
MRKEGLVGFDDAFQALGLDLGGLAQKTVAPTKGRILVDTAVGRRPTHRQPIAQCLDVTQPQGLVA